MKITTVVPVYNGGGELQLCIESLLASGQQPVDIILVDDGSSDGQAIAVSKTLGVKLLSLGPLPAGPARARNHGASLAIDADALWFVDADVLVRPDSLRQLRAALNENPDVDAIFCSYDDTPAAQGFISQYKNLLHHFMHQQAPLKASTFWAGCGIVRCVAFEQVGGFDERFVTASIEDIDLGMRLIDAGFVIHLRGDILCCHLKHWTFWGWLKTDILRRAVPWTKLLMNRGGRLPDALNLGYGERASALIALTGLLGLLMVFFWPGLRGAGVVVVLMSLLVFVFLQQALLVFFLNKRGLAFTIIALLLHCLYFVYATLTFLVVQVLERITPAKDRKDTRAA